MVDFTEDDIIGGVVNDESTNEQNNGDADTLNGETLEDNNDNDIDVSLLPDIFTTWLSGYFTTEVTTIEQLIHEAALTNYGSVTGTEVLSGTLDAGQTLTIGTTDFSTDDYDTLDLFVAAINDAELTGITAANVNNTLVIYTTEDLTLAGDTGYFGLPALAAVAADSFELTKVLTLSDLNLEYLALTTTSAGNPFPIFDDGGTGTYPDGVNSGLNTSGSSPAPIHLWLVPDPTPADDTDEPVYILVGYEVDADGQPIDVDSPAIAIYLDQELTKNALGNDTLVARFYTVQFEGISIDNEDPNDPDALKLIDNEAISLTATSSLDFDATNAPSGQNLFIMFPEKDAEPVADGDGTLRYDYGIVATGRDPADVEGGANLSTGDTVNSSKAKGQDQVFGSNNQMLTADTDDDGIGDTLILTFVQGTNADYTVPDLDQNEADVEANIDFLSALETTGASFEVVQLQSGKAAVLYLTALANDLGDAANTEIRSGSDFEGDLETQLANMNDVMVGFETVVVSGPRTKGKNAPDVTFTTSYAAYLAYISADDDGTDPGDLDFGDKMVVWDDQTENTFFIEVAFGEDGEGLQLSRLRASDTVSYTTDGNHSRLMIENDGDGAGQDSAEFDVGNFSITQVSTESVAIGGIFGFEDDYPAAFKADPAYVEEEHGITGGNEDLTSDTIIEGSDSPGPAVDADTDEDGALGTITNIDYVADAGSAFIVSGNDATAIFALDPTGATLPVHTSQSALIDWDLTTEKNTDDEITKYILTGSVVSITGTLPGGTDRDYMLAAGTYEIDEVSPGVDDFSFTVPNDGATLGDLIDAINGTDFLTAEIDGGDLRVESVFHNALDFTGFGALGISNGTLSTTRDVILFEVTPGGEMKFSVLGQVDHTQGDNLEAAVEFDMSSALIVVDTDGDHVRDLYDLGRYFVIDDKPVDLGGTFGGTVEEEHLPTIGNEDAGVPTEDQDVPGDPGDPNVTTDVATGSLSGLVSVGTDEQLGGGAKFSLKGDATSLATLPDLTSGGNAVSYDVTGNVLTAFIDSGDAGLDAGDKKVFTFELVGPTGQDWKFTLLAPLDHTYSGDPASEENLDLIDGDGSVPGIEFGGLLQAEDFDGDTVDLTGSVLVKVIDDVPNEPTVSVDDSESILKTFDGGLSDGNFPGDDLDEDDNASATIAEVDFTTDFTISGTGDYGADGAGTATTSWKLKLLGNEGDAAIGLKSDGSQIYLHDINGVIYGSTVETGTDEQIEAGAVFSLSNTQGVVTLTQSQELDHIQKDTYDGDYIEDTVALADGQVALEASASTKDADGDTTPTASDALDLGGNVVFGDDGPDDPTVTLKGDAGVLKTFDGGLPDGNFTGTELDEDENKASSVIAIVDFKDNFEFGNADDYGADGAGEATTTWTLKLLDGSKASGLFSDGSAVYLHKIDGMIYGSTVQSGTDDQIKAGKVFTLSNDGSKVTLEQFEELDHSKTDTYAGEYKDDTVALADNLVGLEASVVVKDEEGDTSQTVSKTQDLGNNVVFGDDGPADPTVSEDDSDLILKTFDGGTADGNFTGSDLTPEDTNPSKTIAVVDFKDDFKIENTDDYGADGAGKATTTWSLELSKAAGTDSGLKSDTKAVYLHIFGGVVYGSTLASGSEADIKAAKVFTLSNSGSVVTLEQFEELDHTKTEAYSGGYLDDTVALADGLVELVASVVVEDEEGDTSQTVKDGLDLGGNVVFGDDGPKTPTVSATDSGRKILTYDGGTTDGNFDGEDRALVTADDDPDDNPAVAVVDFKDDFTFANEGDYGADGAGDTDRTWTLRLGSGATAPIDSGLTSDGGTVMLADVSGVIYGYVDTDGTEGYASGDRLVFTVSNSGSVVTLTQSEELDHTISQEYSGNYRDDIVALAAGKIEFVAGAKTTDEEGDTATATVAVLDLGGDTPETSNIIFGDDGPKSPTFNVTDSGLKILTYDGGTTGGNYDGEDRAEIAADDDDSDDPTVAVVDFSGEFSVVGGDDFGADGGGQTSRTWGLQLDGGATGSLLTNLTASGDDVRVDEQGGVVYGYVEKGGNGVYDADTDRLIFTLSQAAGVVTQTQYEELDHPEPGAPYDGAYIDQTVALGDNLVELFSTAKTTDQEGDFSQTATGTLDLGGNVLFGDDGPDSLQPDTLTVWNKAGEDATAELLGDADRVGADDPGTAYFVTSTGGGDGTTIVQLKGIIQDDTPDTLEALLSGEAEVFVFGFGTDTLTAYAEKGGDTSGTSSGYDEGVDDIVFVMTLDTDGLVAGSDVFDIEMFAPIDNLVTVSFGDNFVADVPSGNPDSQIVFNVGGSDIDVLFKGYESEIGDGEILDGSPTTVNISGAGVGVGTGQDFDRTGNIVDRLEIEFLLDDGLGDATVSGDEIVTVNNFNFVLNQNNSPGDDANFLIRAWNGETEVEITSLEVNGTVLSFDVGGETSILGNDGTTVEIFDDTTYDTKGWIIDGGGGGTAGSDADNDTLIVSTADGFTRLEIIALGDDANKDTFDILLGSVDVPTPYDITFETYAVLADSDDDYSAVSTLDVTLSYQDIA
ncbi:hypothetical protein GQ651_11205 [Alphaproteobacteria bacterium GH1-50]|uniref:T1SS-143 domain-containing protein n=1 Tax=Kangsaoukella pontilimi TaxID=2691042 RepID=A0A7C9MXJ4_9RHOB|nr:hypothetical protein [Kangsaoukella pontilimi]MXQ08414.1 hypothetical protein [Kangsaoukella pontilimi]